MLSGLKKVAVPALKEIGKAELPMAQEALEAVMQTEGSMKKRMQAAVQSVAKKENLLALAKVWSAGAIARPF